MSPTAKSWAVVVTYHPDERVVGNVRALVDEGLSVVVVDNGSGDSPVLSQLAEIARVELVRLDRNLGVAGGLNVGVSRAMERGAEWLFTFDQDSRIVAGFVPAMISSWREAEQRYGPVALVAPRYRDQRTGRLLTRRPGLRPLRDAMTSGNLLRPETFRRVGLFADDYFIDYVDTEFCLRCRKSGLQVIQAESATLLHNLGDTRWIRVPGRELAVVHQKPFRRYYMMRNRLRTYARYGAYDPLWLLEEFRRVAVEEAKMLVFERERGRKLVFQLRGILDAVRGKAGPLK